MGGGDRDVADRERPLVERVVDAVPAMLAYWDSTLRCRFANREYERWFGVSPESMVGRHVSELLGEALYQLNRPYLEGALGGTPQKFEREIPDPAGGPARHSLVDYIPDQVGGVVRGFFVHVADISERKRFEVERDVLAEAGAVLASSLNYKQTLKGIAAVLVPRVADFCAVDIVEGGEPTRLTLIPADPSKAALCARLAALPLNRRRMLTWSAIERKQTEVRDITEEQLDEMAQSPEHRDLLRALAPRSGIVAPMFSGGVAFGALVLVSTTPGRYGARDAGFATELARRAALAIENARHYEAAQRATQARDEVLAVVAHDVRNPLAAIGFAATALAHEHARDGSDRAKRSVEVIMRSVDRANRLIADLVDTTRIEAGALSVARDELSATEVIMEAAEAERPLATEASLELRLDVAPELPRICADRARLLQVFENLVGNAIRYTAEGGRITLGATANPGEALFWVADTGIGMPPEALPHVFDRFSKAKGSSQHGSGLGLSICKGIVEAHGGRLWVESVPGRGTTFSFTIPAAPPAGKRGNVPPPA